MTTSPVRVALAGVGYWGINHLRVFGSLEHHAQVVGVCDPSEAALRRAARFAHSAVMTRSFEDIVRRADVDAVVIATPATTHAELAIQALEAGKHVLVEKPLALCLADAQRVARAAAAAGRACLVGHLMLYHPVTVRLRELLSGGSIGDLYYLYSSRVNLGRLRRDENALWSFAPHDLSMIDYLVGALPISVTARGQSYLQDGIEDVVFVSLRFAGGVMAHIHLSWLDPRKERRLTLVCSKKMVEFDDVGAEKLKIYDKGYERPPEFTQFDEYLQIRHGDVTIPHIRMEEPLAIEARHFIDCVRGRATPRTDAASGARVVAILQAAQESLARDGAPVALTSV